MTPLAFEPKPTYGPEGRRRASVPPLLRALAILLALATIFTTALSQPQVPLRAVEPSGIVSLDERGRLVRGGRAYVPSGFSADYRTRWELWEPLLDGMAAHYADPVVRFNLAGVARGGLVLHADVAPGLVNPQAAANLLRLVELFRARGVGYWIVWLHRGGAGTTVPLVWTDRWDQVEPSWQASPWHASNGGPLRHPREAFDPAHDAAWQASLDWILVNFGDDPLFVQLELVAEGYLTDPFRTDPEGFLAWQERMLRYVRGHPAYRGTLLSTGDGTAVVRGQVATHAVAGADVFNAHLHPQPGDDKPKIVSVVESGAPWGIYHHTQHPALAHVVAAPYWNGALGYGQYVSRLYSAEEFGEVRTRLDRHAIAEYVFSGNLGTGMPWDHEGHLVTFGAVARYAEVIDFYREHAIVDDRELDLRPAWRDHGDVVGLYLVGDDRTLAYVFSKVHWDDEEAARGTYRIEVPSAWGDVSLEVRVGDRVLFRVSEPVD